MDEDIKRIRQLAGIQENVVDIGSRQQAAAGREQQARGEAMQNLIAAVAENLTTAYDAWVRANWERDGRPGSFEDYYRNEAQSEGIEWFQERLAELTEMVEEQADFYLREKLSK